MRWPVLPKRELPKHHDVNRIVYEVRLALTAVQYLTRVPVPGWVGYSPAQLSRSVRYFPLTGIVVGAVAGLFFTLALKVFPQTVAALISMIASVLVTGGFHEDGLADTCDGLGGGSDKAQALAIMKDSRVGSYAVLGLTLTLLLKFASLSALPAEWFVAIAIAAHAFSRFMSVTVMATQKYARDDSTAKANITVQRIGGGALVYAALWAMAPLWFLGVAGLVGAAVATVTRVVAARYMYQRVGGYTGDCLGAIQQLTELSFYLSVLAWISI
jgi:adenosylcobinamide-GDP ribazoletransferase